MAALTAVKSCAATACAFNKEQSCSVAVTVGTEAACKTFLTLDVRSKTSADGQVSACHRLDCKYNDALQCTAEQVTIEGAASCGTYEARA